jgi:2-iminobutanoate/2-iminopropanoate deaminase
MAIDGGKKMKKYAVRTSQAASPQAAYSQGWRAGDFIFVSGTGPIDPKTGKLAGSSIEEQTEQVVANMRSVLVAAGATLQDVVKVAVHLHDPSLFARYDAAYARYFSAPYPARTTVGSDLGQLPGMLIEADCVAYVQGRKTVRKKPRRS